jgi:hypothetical protein
LPAKETKLNSMNRKIENEIKIKVGEKGLKYSKYADME